MSQMPHKGMSQEKVGIYANLTRALVVLDALGLAISFVPTPRSVSNVFGLDRLQPTTPMDPGVAALTQALSAPNELNAVTSSVAESISRALDNHDTGSLVTASAATAMKNWLPAGVFGPGLLAELAGASFDQGDTDERGGPSEDGIEEHT